MKDLHDADSRAAALRSCVSQKAETGIAIRHPYRCRGQGRLGWTIGACVYL
jgi:hypothetical protein